MGTYVARRLGHAALTLVIVSVVTFLLVSLAPSGFVIESAAGMSAEDLARIRTNLGLDLPVHVQYLRWATGLVRGDLGRSLINGQPVLGLIGERLPNTLQLAGVALIAATAAGVLLVILCAVRVHSRHD